MRIYLQDILDKLTTLYDDLDSVMVDAERTQIKTQRFVPPANPKKKKSTFEISSELFNPDNYENCIEPGEIVALIPMSELIQKLENDIEVLEKS